MGVNLRGSRFLLLGISLLLALHALAVSRYLSSGLFLIVFFCWLWVGASALLHRLDAIKAMTVTMTVILVLAAVAAGAVPLLKVDTKAFFLLGMFPSLTAWICVRVYVLHLQRAQVDGSSPLVEWFDDSGAGGPAHDEHSGAVGQRFLEEMASSVAHSNEPPAEADAWAGRHRLRAAG